MLVTCSQCGVGFDHALGRCIACGAEYAPSGEERVAVLTHDAEGWLQRRSRPAVVVRRLIDEFGVDEAEASLIVQRANRTLRDESRRHGAYVATSGIVLLLIAGAVHFLTVGSIIAIGCLALGGAMVVIGGLKAFTGWNITGHDDE
jgi:hypothetical protein